MSDRLLIQGARLSIAPGDEAWTLNVGESATVRTCYGGVCGAMASSDPRVAGLQVKAELSGPELAAPVTYTATPGGGFVLPGFQTEGTYLLSSIRLVRAAVPGVSSEEVLGSATPAAVVLEVRQILFSTATVRQLTLAELQARGIEITQQNFNAYGRLWRTSHPDGTSQAFSYYSDDTVELWTKRSGIQLKHIYDPGNRLLARQVTSTGGAGAPQTDGGDTFAWDPLSRLMSADRPSSNAPAVAYAGYDSAGRPKDEMVGGRAPLVRSWDTWSREAGVVLPVGIGGHEAGSYYARTFDNLDRVTGVTGASPAVGAIYAWGGVARLYSQVTNGPLHTAHRYSFTGSGIGPEPGGTATSRWRLGVLSVGSSTDETEVTGAPSHPWGRLGYGYRPRAGLKVGRKVLTPSSLLAGQGWKWGLDASSRLSWAEPGEGTLDEQDDPPASRLQVSYGEGDEIRAVVRIDAGESAVQTVGGEGRILSRNDVLFAYDAEGHRIGDDRYDYVWNYRDELVSVTVKACWPVTPTDFIGQPSADCPAGQAKPLYAGQRTQLLRDALGRVFAERRLGSPATPGDDASRPFLEEKEFLWDGGTLLSEAGRSADGTLLWRKSYVPGPSGLDDAVQLRVEKYDLAGSRTSDRLFSYVRDEQGSTLALVEELEGADPAKPSILQRYFYDPWGQAHAEIGPEVRSASVEPDQLSLSLPGGSTVNQSVDSVTAVGGRFRLVLSLPAEETTLPTGLHVERRLADGTWGTLDAAEVALARDSSAPDSILLLPISGWLKGTTYRVRLSEALRDILGRSASSQPALEIPIPADGSPVSFDRRFPLSYETFLAAGETANGVIPGGQSILWQGAWTSSLGGHQLKRARVYDPRTASFLSEDPLGDIDSPNLYGYVAGRPHEATDPWGLAAADECARAENPDLCRHFKALSASLDAERARNATPPVPAPTPGITDRIKAAVARKLGAVFSKYEQGRNATGQVARDLGTLAVQPSTQAIDREAIRDYQTLTGSGANAPTERLASAQNQLSDATATVAEEGGEQLFDAAAAKAASTIGAVGGVLKRAPRANRRNYNRLFRAARPNLPAGWPVHHSLPQEYEALFELEGINIHEMQYLRGMDPQLHGRITTEWARFARAHGGAPSATEVAEFAKEVDKKYGGQFIWLGY